MYPFKIVNMHTYFYTMVTVVIIVNKCKCKCKQHSKLALNLSILHLQFNVLRIYTYIVLYQVLLHQLQPVILWVMTFQQVHVCSRSYIYKLVQYRGYDTDPTICDMKERYYIIVVLVYIE